MKIYSDVLTRQDLQRTSQEVPGLLIDEIEDVPNPKVRSRGWTLRTGSSTRKRCRNSGQYGADAVRAASWDDHGKWFALLYRIDPAAKIARYKDVDDFHRKTARRFAPSLAG